MANIFTDILKGMGKGMTQYGRNMGQRLGLVKLASRVKSVNPEDYATTEEYQRALNESNAAYRRLEQEMATPTYTALDKLLGISPEEVRTVRSAENVLSPQQGAKDLLAAAQQVVTLGVPGGLGWAGVPLAAGVGAARGGMGHIASSMPGEELEGVGKTAGISALLGTLGYGAGEASRALSSKMSSPTKITETLSVKEIAKLPKKTRSGLVKQAKSAGMWSDKVSESSNIESFLRNREYAGNTPAQTLEKTTQGLADAGKLKQAGLEEVGGLSRGYIDQVKNNIRESVKYSGLNATEKTALDSMFKVLDEAPTDAKTLDKIAQDWYKMGLTRAGEQRMTQSGLYKEGAKAIRDALKEANAGGDYTQAMSSLSQLLGTEDEGLVARAAEEATKGRINIPLVSGAGVKLPIRDALSKAGAAWGRAQEAGTLSAATPAMQKFMEAQAQSLGMSGGALQYATPYVGAIRGVEEPTQDQPIQQVGQPVPSIQPQAGYEPMQPQGGYYPGAEADGYMGSVAGYGSDTAMPSGQLGQLGQSGELKQLLAMGILSGEIKASDATAILSLLGLEDQGGAEEEEMGPTTEGQRDYQLAAEAMQGAYDVLLNQGGAGKFATWGGNVSSFFGQPTASSAYRAALDTATSFLRKALIGTGQSESELRNLNLPKPTDEPEVAREKIESLMPLLRARAGLQAY